LVGLKKIVTGTVYQSSGYFISNPYSSFLEIFQLAVSSLTTSSSFSFSVTPSGTFYSGVFFFGIVK
jgi:hypothetical protein